MKKFFLHAALSLSLMVAAQAQNANGHFSMRYSGGVAETNLEAFCRAQLPKLCEGSTFEVVSDRSGLDGMQHVTLQQYVNGVRASDRTINIHVRQGKITSINGNVMTQEMMSPALNMNHAPRRAAEVLQQAGLSERFAEKAELVWFEQEGAARLAYRVLAGTDRMLVDAITGEVLVRTSAIMHWDMPQGEAVQGSGQTFYLGVQEFDHTRLADGRYALLDHTRGNYTIDASYEAMTRGGYSWEKLQQLSSLIGFSQWPHIEPRPAEVGEIPTMLGELASACGSYLNDEPLWNRPLGHACIDSLTYCVEFPESACTYGKYVYADITKNNVKICSDTILVTGKRTVLHLPEPVAYGASNELVVNLNAIFPDTGEDRQVDQARAQESYSTQMHPLTYPFIWDFMDGNEPNDDYDDFWLMNMMTTGYLLVHNHTDATAPMIDVHWGIQNALDYYRDVFQLDSFDGKGTPVYSFVNAPDALFPSLNAFAYAMEDKQGAPGIMIFGLGGNNVNIGLFHPFVPLIIIGHEFTHLVARVLSSETPDDENNFNHALNESFADIMGFALERYVTGHETWALNVGVMPYGIDMRRFDEPEACGHPSSYLDSNFDTERYEEHCNAGVQNHMFYLLVEGGEGVNSLGQDYAVTPMDRTEAELLTFTTIYNYAFAGMNYEDAAEAWVDAAIGLFGENSSQVRSVRQAWAAVGLGDGDITSIEQLSQDNTQKRGIRYNLQGQRVGNDYTGVVISR